MPAKSLFRPWSGTLTEEEVADDIVAVAEDLGVSLPKGRGARRLWGPRHWALRHVNFTLKRGESIGVMGRNGSGKSTLLRTVAGIIASDEGSLRFAPDLDCIILAPGAGFDNELTGRENLIASSLLRGYLPDAIKPRMEDIIAFSEIGSWVDEPVGIYSAGMRARLGFALSLFMPSDVLMIDETLSAGDAVFREKARDAIQSLAKSGRTVIVVSHNPDMIRSMCTKGIVLDNGAQIAGGDIENVLIEYRNRTTGPKRRRDSETNERIGIDSDADDHEYEHIDLDTEATKLARKRQEAKLLQKEASAEWLNSEHALADASAELIAAQEAFISYLRTHPADKETPEIRSLEDRVREASEAASVARDERDRFKKAFADARTEFDQLRADVKESA